MPVRVQEAADLFRSKVVDGEGIRERPRVVRLLLRHGRHVTNELHSVNIKQILIKGYVCLIIILVAYNMNLNKIRK